MFSAAGKTAAAVSTAANYIEDVFSTYLYTGTGSTQTITNGIDLSTKGGLVWVKNRSSAYTHVLVDTVRGTDKVLCSNNANAEQTGDPGFVTQFNTNGFAIGDQARVNLSSSNFVSWTFREQPKFFDVVTYTGNGTAGRTISHSLGSVPGCIIIKKTSDTENWGVYHRSLGNTQSLALNLTNAAGAGFWNSTTPTSTVFTIGNQGQVNDNGQTYVAYLFAHDAGGFGLTGTDNVISCGSFTTDGSGNATVSLGYEPQWVLIKQTDGADNWYLNDNMRGMAVSGNQPNLSPNLSAAEQAGGYNTYPNATGFTASVGIASKNYIYIAIRRGPMKTPTTGTSVFDPEAVNGSTAFTTGFPVDLAMFGVKVGSVDNFMTFDRLRGSLAYLKTTSTAAEGTTTSTYETVFDNNTGSNYKWWSNTNALIGWNFRRAPGFFDVVCYTGTGSARTINHNLGVAPELMIVKRRNDIANWTIYLASVGNDKAMNFDTAAPFSDPTGVVWNLTTPTSTVFSVGTNDRVNGSGSTYVNYLFASCPGVSKVGSYTGTGTTLQIDCGFTGGARFVLIKRTDSTGDWYCWDSSRGIVSGNDPYLLLNSTAAEVTNTDYVDTYSAGFEISSTAPAAINANGGTFVFLAVA
jgi:hypothetical protein